MKEFLISLIIVAWVIPSAAASEANTAGFCKPLSDNVTCTHRCIRSLGGLCLITRTDFHGTEVKAGNALLKSEWLTCKSVDVDLQLEEVRISDADNDTNGISAAVSAVAKSSSDVSTTRSSRQALSVENASRTGTYRIPFDDFLNSGEDAITAMVTLDACFGSSQSCNISGRLIATTNPNIRCELHEPDAAGGYLNRDSEKVRAGTAGRIGQ